MKYLQLFEAFKSKVISGVLKYVKSNTSDAVYKSFISDLKRLLSVVDYPISELSDDFLVYMGSKKAYMLKNDEPVTNEYGLWAIKFWFSLEGGYLGYSGTGNLRATYLEGEKSLTPGEIERLKEIKPTGILTPVTNYSKQLINGATCVVSMERRRPVFAKLYRDNISGAWYVIQSDKDGGHPDSDDWYQMPYTEFGNYSWWIYGDHKGTDHSKLHIYTPSDTELDYEDRSNKEQNPMMWNLILNYYISHSPTYHDLKLLENSYTLPEKADYAVVLFFDNLTNPDVDAPHYDPVSDTKLFRKGDKEGALSLVSDEDFRRINIDRYITAIGDKYHTSISELKYPDKFLKKFFIGKYSLINIISSKSTVSGTFKIDNYMTILLTLKDYFKSGSSYAKTNIAELKNLYKTDYRNFMNLLRKEPIIQKKSKNKTVKPLYDKIFEMGDKISKWIDNQNIETFDDLFFVINKIKSIKQLHDGYREVSKVSNELNRLIWYFFEDYRFEDDEKEFNLERDMNYLNLLDKYIDSILV